MASAQYSFLPGAESMTGTYEKAPEKCAGLTPPSTSCCA